MMIDLGTGNNNKINWAMNNKQELIDIIETIYRGARKGKLYFICFLFFSKGVDWLYLQKIILLNIVINIAYT